MEYFKHYKGNYYRYIGEARHSESLEPMVIYQAMYGDMSTWVRPKVMFYGSVNLPDGRTVLRFAPCTEDEAMASLKRKDDKYESLIDSLFTFMQSKGYVAEDFTGSCSLCGEDNEFILDQILAEVRREYPDISDDDAEALTGKIYTSLYQRFKQAEEA